MDGIPKFNPRSDAIKRHDEPGPGDDVPCVKCGGALDTGLECSECGHDNYEAVTGKPFAEAKPAKCDGNHGGPQCADPECWHDSPQQPVESIRWVTDGSFPDADELVLVEGPDHGDVWCGCYDGEQWLTQDCMPTDVNVLAWAEWPAGSKGGAQ